MKLFEILSENVTIAPVSNVQAESVMSAYQKYCTESELRKYDYHVARTIGEATDTGVAIKTAIDVNENMVSAIVEFSNYMIGKLETHGDVLGGLREAVLLRGIEEGLSETVPAIHQELCEETTIIGIHAVRHLVEQKNVLNIFKEDINESAETISKINKCLGIDEAFYKEAIGNTVPVANIVESVDTSKEVCNSIATSLREFVLDIEKYSTDMKELYEHLDARDINTRGEKILSTVEAFNEAVGNAFENIFLKSAIVENTTISLFDIGSALLK